MREGERFLFQLECSMNMKVRMGMVHVEWFTWNGSRVAMSYVTVRMLKQFSMNVLHVPVYLGRISGSTTRRRTPSTAPGYAVGLGSRWR